MQFQKEYNVRNEAVFSDLEKLTSEPGLQIAVKDATREGKEFLKKETASGLLGSSLIGWYGNEVHSPRLIEWADIVIVSGFYWNRGHAAEKGCNLSRLPKHERYILRGCENCYSVHSYEELLQTIADIDAGVEQAHQSGGQRFHKRICLRSGTYDVLQFYASRLASDELPY